MSSQKYPVDGMRKMPALCEDNPIMASMFIGCVQWAFSEPKIIERFKIETGHDFNRLKNRSSIEAAVDRATGFEKSMFANFADWVAENIWGE